MKIYVVTHESVNIDLPVDYELFQVGATVNGVFCEYNDAVGEDNISAKNPNYCELTAAYWIWKNDHENDIVGLMHYRRFLTCSRLSNANKYWLNTKQVECMLHNGYDFIAGPLFKNKPSVKHTLLNTVYEKDYRLLREIFKKIYPGLLCAFDNVFEGKYTYLCNIFIATKKEWDEYYSWLFTIFDEMEKHVDMTGYNAQEKRLYGYLAERLFTIYVIAFNKKVKSFRLIYPRVRVPFIKRVIRKLKRIINKND